MKIDLSMADISVTGLKRGDMVPSMLKAIKTTPDDHFLTVAYESSPLNSKAASKIKLETKQLEIIYDARSLQRLIDCFTWPAGVELVKYVVSFEGNNIKVYNSVIVK